MIGKPWEAGYYQKYVIKTTEREQDLICIIRSNSCIHSSIYSLSIPSIPSYFPFSSKSRPPSFLTKPLDTLSLIGHSQHSTGNSTDASYRRSKKTYRPHLQISQHTAFASSSRFACIECGKRTMSHSHTHTHTTYSVVSPRRRVEPHIHMYMYMYVYNVHEPLVLSLPFPLLYSHCTSGVCRVKRARR